MNEESLKYPLILIPKEYQEIRHFELFNPSPIGEMPPKPKLYNRKIGCFVMLIPAILFIVLAVLNYDIDGLIGTIMWIVFFGGLLLANQGSKFDDAQLLEYEKIKNNIEEEKEYLELYQKLKHNSKLFFQYKKYKYIYWVKSGEPHYSIRKFGKIESLPKKGRTEQFFKLELMKYFKEILYTDIYVDTYFPDFLIIDINNGIKINIEIDEPYSLKEKLPIHYVEDINEKIRNDFFLENGYFVVRFAEEQIINDKQACLQLLKGIYDTVKEFEPIEKIKSFEKQIQGISRWSLKEAIQYAESDYRHFYLNKMYNSQHFMSDRQSSQDLT